ncbi:hypothetical protein J18TS1_35790 [Oceanobacillus oncorhynchi subsp. incaldanensis]|uniref:DUF418 domain-containing protein n=2 Tax=Oceanobacillus TaxID=182709 RepID=A0A0A1MBL1_9BACI|nr:DUF418 domain-containing protein [Oceanobacillus oncorhynchi]MDM8101685.1 DUF418 domain-containing protein [Oceanobacillus oncorhynchi]GIO20479.1 hypothetical protein J18TS1_35790 [Oceanobacillus oncorhynchi subsp. incaldanensis]CEI82735.1 hypothetical protein BN997_02621 [Oceanobacillus oncorhynchi]
MADLETTQTKRALSLDLARGFMLFLIILSHIPLFLYTIEPGVITKVSGSTAFDHFLNFLMEITVDNRARPLFAILFGYGLVMIYRKQSERKGTAEAKRLIKRRCWYLILFGAILAGVAGGQDILMTYGIAGLLLVSCLKKDNKKIKKYVLISTVICIIYIPLFWGGVLTENQSYGLPVELTGQETYAGTILERLVSIPIIPLFTHITFPVIPSVLIGMWLGNINILIKPQHHLKLLKQLSVIGVTISLAGAIPLVLINDVWFPSLFTAGIVYGIHILTGFAGGLSYAALFGWLGARMKQRGGLVKAIAAMGKRSLTFFVLHEVLIVILLSPIAFNLGASLTVTTSLLIGTVMWMVTLSIAYWMERRQIAGPLENYLRYLIYNKQRS